MMQRTDTTMVLVMFGIGVGAIMAATCLGAEDQPVLRIPGIVTKWKIPGDSDKPDTSPETTIAEISACVGLDFQAQQKVLELKKEQAALESAYEALPQPSEAMKRESAAIEAERGRINKLSATIETAISDIERRRQSLERTRPSNKATPEQVKVFNEKVAAFNADLVKGKKQSEELNAISAKLRGRIEVFNKQVAEMNEKVKQFDERNEAFRIASTNFDSEVDRYRLKCSGERKLKK